MNKNNITIFNFEGSSLEVFVDESERLWVVASTLAKVLDYTDARHMTRSLDEDEVMTKVMVMTSANGVQQNREVSLVSESGMYHAIFLSRKEGAIAFRRWVTEHVLPAIRKTNKYDHDEHLAKIKSEFNDVAKTLTVSKSFMVEVVRANNEAEIATLRKDTAESILGRAEKALDVMRKASVKLPKREKGLVQQAIAHFEEYKEHIDEAKSGDIPWFPWELYDYLDEGSE